LLGLLNDFAPLALRSRLDSLRECADRQK
jgi:hypothetical protein